MKREKIKSELFTVIIISLCVLTVALDFIKISYSTDIFRNRILSAILQQACGGVVAVLLMIRLDIRLFGKPQNLLYLIPCLVVAVDNFPFWSYFSGNMHFVNTETVDYILFAIYCLCIGWFEECIFRGVIFAVLAGRLSADRKGFLWTYLISSLIFGGAHLFNILNGAGVGPTILQVGYTILTGGLFAFAMIKTKNVFCAAIIHAIYNFCGLLLSEQGLGTGIVFDTGTVIMMTIISVCAAIFVLYRIWKISEDEIKSLYALLGVCQEHESEE